MTGLLTGLSVFLIVTGIYMIVSHRRYVLDAVILADTSSRAFVPVEEAKTLFDNLARKLEVVAQALVRNDKQKEKLNRLLDQAGERITAEQLVSRQLAGGLIGLLFGGTALIAGSVGVIIAVLFSFYGFMYPKMIIHRKWRTRRRQIGEDLLPFTDVLALMLETGSSLYGGMEKAAKAVGGPLGEDMEAMLKQGQREGFTEALHKMGTRINHPMLDGLITIISQANRYGAGMDVVHALRQFSFALRTHRRHEIDREIQKMGIKILFPIFFFILVPMMAILFAPVLASFGQSGLL
ncbi:hypothetical protein GCM10010965_29850 [Caldalkalibacillus thermarum]|uniref:type II secretion system F family protein n=1 Tax=Caldalkalibacillus thermarum TaxID=296745 RepID=UPI001665914C|nr:type II secretion system F family protein [Caldalkalibacillus thermarum]GGK34934.1 hypothetical protein GCM10010965_29850 [Caldalkalibacillus thermarum]